MRDKKFVMDSIKMDLYRVVTAVGDVTKPVATTSALSFLRHADGDFEKVDLTEIESKLHNRLKSLMRAMSNEVNEPIRRLRWAEDVLTLRCML